jgi:ribosomal protein S20
MKTTKLFSWFRSASQTAPRKQFLKESITTLARVVSLVVSLILVLQCLALPTLVTAGTNALRNTEQSKTRKKKKKRAKANKAGQLTRRRVIRQNKAASATSRPVVKEKEADKLASRPVVKENEADKLASRPVVKEKESDKLASRPVVKEKEADKLATRPVKENTEKLTSRGALKDNKADQPTTRPMMIVPPFWSIEPSRPASVDTGGIATKMAEPAPVQSSQELKPVQRDVTVLPPVNISELGTQKSFGMNSTAPVELKPIHPPEGLPEGARKGVTINEGPLQRKTGETFWSKQGNKSMIASIPSPAPSRTFKSDNLSIGFIPPDTMGAVGLNHVVTVTNEKVIIHDRNGVILSTVTLNAFWAVTPNGLATPSTFDPKILYDRFNDRFIFVVVANNSNPTSATLLAVSQTGDPTGLWHRYSIDADSTATAGGGSWADFPSVGFNMNWITISINRFGYGSVSGYQGPSI